MNEKTLSIIGTLGTILFGVFASLVAWFAGGKDLQGNTKEVIRQMFNFELTIFVAGLVLGWIPLVGILVGLVIFVSNIVFAIKSFIAANKGEEFKAPAFAFIK